MASIKTILRKKSLANGHFPVCLRVTKDRRTKYFKTLFSIPENEWDLKGGQFNKRNANYIQNNRLLNKILDRALKIYGNLEIETEDFTLEDFEKHFRVDSNPARQKEVFSFWKEIIDEMNEAGRTGNAKVNSEALNSVKLFHQKERLSFKEITPTFLIKYEVFLRSRGGTDGGIGVRMRSIRALFNFAIQRNITKEGYYPFRTYKLSKLKGKAIKKALTMDEVTKITHINLEDYPTLINAQNYFIFSFYTRGMNFADMIKLRWKDVSYDRIHYTRSKTKGNFSIKILEPVQKILDYYKDINPHTSYVFPVLFREDYTPTQLENRKHKMLVRYNQDLKKIAAMCQINKPMSSYVARHSFANCLKQKGVATDIISESMGHKNLTVTQSYLKELESRVIDEASEILL
ncbi:site-specific integrase [uncultured Maribacter sp.]|uniref:site-specific integrase n=1 Tax=uncultured Maribacter sp. TaxID=431308 RepID=UPI00260D8D15|nr:site-specific integrase [uncultured Maribacter sp.]